MVTPRVVPTDWGAASRLVADAYFPHTLTRLSRDSTAGAVVHTAELGPIRLAGIGWGADVTVESAHPGGYAVNIPISGHLTSVTAGVEVTSPVGWATVCPPDTDTHITGWNRACRILGVGIDRAHLDREMLRVLETERRLPLQIDLTTPEGASWLRLVTSLARQLSDDPGVLSNPLVAEHLAGAVTSALILAATPAAPAPAPRPRIVKRVLDALQADPGRAWTAGDMAECAGVGVRRLQEGFRRHVGRSPSECLLDIRLERAHEELVAAEPSRTVTDIARQWGFTHPGRFAAAYRGRYGTSPSQVLRG
ncbi:AraC family transcriptional regulator [Rhodococcus sp. NPDC058532]|uniref:AraC family transcriptional regulator n=1 Tax=Rhodococcus sp. NPDC058532 TaxID=3346540 RepID=UPI00366647CD